jgi:hypothetical protein
VEAQKDMRHLTNMLKSFIKLDGLLDERNFSVSGNYTKFSDADWDSTAGVEETPKRTVREMTDEVRTYVGKLASTLDAETNGKYQLGATFKIIMQKKTPEPGRSAQTQAAKNFGELLDGALNELQNKGVNVADLFSKVQNAGGNSLIQGIRSESSKKTEADEGGGNIFEFRPYIDQVVEAKIVEYKDLQRKIAETPARSAADIKIIENERVNKIMRDYESGNFAAQPDDAKILDDVIGQLRGELSRKKTGSAPGEGQQGGPTGRAA